MWLLDECEQSVSERGVVALMVKAKVVASCVVGDGDTEMADARSMKMHAVDRFQWDAGSIADLSMCDPK